MSTIAAAVFDVVAALQGRGRHSQVSAAVMLSEIGIWSDRSRAPMLYGVYGA
jgi:hypothetical protein